MTDDDADLWDEVPPWEVTAQSSVEPAVEVLRPFRRLRLDLDKPPVPTPMLVRGLYGDGCLTMLQSEPGVGKSWVATWMVLSIILAGFSVVYVDEEGGPELMTERLVALGADPAMVAEQVFYYAFESRRWDDEDLLALDHEITAAMHVGRGLALGVLDSLPDFLAAAGLSEDSAMEVTGFVKKVCGRFRSVGSAQLLLDHLVKPAADGRSRRSRYGRGSGAKLAKADATLLLEAPEEFDARTSGLLRMWKTKDRRGRLELPTLSKPGLDLTVTVSDGTLRIVEREPEDRPVWDGPTECMGAIGELLRSAPETEFTSSQIYTNLRATGKGFRKETVFEAAERLARDWEDISVRSGGRGARIFHATSVQMEVF